MTGYLNVDELRALVGADEVDTVVLAMPDMYGRLQGKRLDARHFLEDILGGGLNTCSYLLARDIDMEVSEGFDFATLDTGMPDFTLVPDLPTMRRLPWMPGAVLVTADVQWGEDRPVVQAPRSILRRQIERLEERGWTAMVSTELEFLLFENDYRDAHERRYHGLRAATYYDSDYSIVGTSRQEPLMRQVRRAMRDAGMPVEGVTGECNIGQFELGFKYDEAMVTCDNHILYKEGIKEIAMQNDVSVTFMPKFDGGAGNSCHVHFSLYDEQGDPVFATGRPGEMSQTLERFIAGQLAAARELSLFAAPSINAYKRFGGGFAPGGLSWGRDNRTSAIRVLGEGRGLRLENRLPGGDANPYLAVAAVIAAGLHGVDAGLELEPEAVGNVYDREGEGMPRSLLEAAELWSKSGIAAAGFGPEVVHHYANAAFKEVEAFEAATTDWERARGFERM